MLQQSSPVVEAGGYEGVIMPLARAVFPAEPSAPRAARRWLADTLTSSGCDPDCKHTAVLLTSELVTNAVLHAHSPVEIRVVADGELHVEVHDQSDAAPVPQRHDVDATSGRGIALVEALAASYGYEVHDEGGKRVWFKLRAS